MTSPTERHNDLPDTTLDILLADLHDVYTAPTPPPGLRAAIERLEEAPTPVMSPTRPIARRFALRRRGPRALAVIGVPAAVVGIGAAIADSGLVQQALSLLPGGTDQRYTVALNQSRSACGYTIALKTAYADQNRLVIGYDVDVPPGRTFADIDLAGLTATDARGTRLAPLNAADTSNLNHAAGAAHGNVQEFDTGAALISKMLRVRLAATALRGEEIVTGTAPAATSCETDGVVAMTRTGYGKPRRAVTVAIRLRHHHPFQPEGTRGRAPSQRDITARDDGHPGADRGHAHGGAPVCARTGPTPRVFLPQALRGRRRVRCGGRDADRPWFMGVALLPSSRVAHQSPALAIRRPWRVDDQSANGQYRRPQ